MANSKELILILKSNGEFELDFNEISLSKKDIDNSKLYNDLYKIYKENKFKLILNLAFLENKKGFSDSLNYLCFVANTMMENLMKNPAVEFLREKAEIELDDEKIQQIIVKAPFINGLEYLDKDWITSFVKKLNKIYSDDIKVFDGSCEKYFKQFKKQLNKMGRVYFHLVESKKDEYPFAFLATYWRMKPDGKRSKHLPLKNALEEYKTDEKKLLELLSTVFKAGNESNLISKFINSGDIFHPLKLSADEAYIFLKEIEHYEKSGITCRIPNWWKRKSQSLRVSVNVGDKVPTGLSGKELIKFDINLCIGDEEISYEELIELAKKTDGLELIKGNWVEVDKNKLTETIKAYEKAQQVAEYEGMNMLDAMRLQLTASEILGIKKDECEVEVTNGEWLGSVLERLQNPGSLEEINCENGFRAVLREYQAKGLNWLSFMKKLRLGALLADDMGLGKTVQVLALVNNSKDKTLLIVPASLIGNWINEINKFSPKLKYYILHPSENKNFEDKFEEIYYENELFITTYKMISKYNMIKDKKWNTLVLDEAQAIKNPGTKQTKAVKELKAQYKLAMTGTPIENNLSDLWSIFDFLNKGLLGTKREFNDYTKKIKDEEIGYGKLKNLVSPFILRRLKTDKSIISDLPEKIEMKTYSNLSKKQLALYKKLVDEIKIRLEETNEGIQKKGIVLASLLKFKQICNHPAQFLGQDDYLEKDSGKYERLKEICETIYEKREKVLIFTQFKEITEHLKNYLEEIFKHEGLVLHGQTTVKKRKEIVERFQSSEYIPFLVLSIKAGGVGLNLTEANHVIHFDRWWNPAVENQATDRAFRIGQKKNVVVHKFITRGTVEEKIDKMIENKQKLSEEIVSDVKETWITEMDNKDIINLFSLSI